MINLFGIRIRPIVAWYDFWIGIFIDKPKSKIYFFPIPCIGLVFTKINRLERVMNYLVEEFADGTFQVINQKNEVLRPGAFEWLGLHQRYHDFMYFSDLDQAKHEAELTIKRDSDKRTIVKTYQFEVEEDE